MPRIQHVVLGLGLVSACSSSESVETTFDPCSPLTIAVESAHAEDVATVESALAAWGQVLPIADVAVTTSAPAGEDVLTVRFLDGQRTARGNYWDSVGVVEISRDMLALDAQPIALAHELGHSFGLLHVDAATRPSVMNSGNLTVEPTTEDAAQVKAIWAACRTSQP